MQGSLDHAGRFVLVMIFSALLCACGGGSGSGEDDDALDNGIDAVDDNAVSATITPQDELGPGEAIVIAFNQSMDPASLALGGSLAETAQATWSNASADNDTLTLRPGNAWPVGRQTLTLDAGSREGAAMPTLEVQFDVRASSASANDALTVIGQRDFNSNRFRQGGEAPDANTLNLPLGPVAYAPEQDILFIADSNEARVLAFRGIPDVNGANANFVLGQADFTSSRTGVSVNSMISPQNVTAAGGRLIVTDNDGNRVLVYDAIPTSGDARPAVVVGQDTMDERTGSCDANSLIHPHAHFLTPDGKLLVADAANNRVLVWNALPAENGAAADLVLGQPGFGGCSFLGAGNFKHPASLWSDGETLIVADSEKHRVLIWNRFPSANFTPPDVILGQDDITHQAPNDADQDGQTDANGAASARVFNYPRGVWVENGRLYVADMDNHRVLAWNEVPRTSFAPADRVIGQDNFIDNRPNAGEMAANARGFQRPVGVRVINGQLFVTDWENSRVLVFDDH